MPDEKTTDAGDLPGEVAKLTAAIADLSERVAALESKPASAGGELAAHIFQTYFREDVAAFAANKKKS